MVDERASSVVGEPLDATRKGEPGAGAGAGAGAPTIFTAVFLSFMLPVLEAG
jgi:hypothetical protein